MKKEEYLIHKLSVPSGYWDMVNAVAESWWVEVTSSEYDDLKPTEQKRKFDRFITKSCQLAWYGYLKLSNTKKFISFVKYDVKQVCKKMNWIF